MRQWNWVIVFVAGALAGCMASAPPLGGSSASAPSPASTSAAPRGPLPAALVIDRTDLRIGTTAQFTHVPNVQELHDASLLPGLAHVMLTLGAWPEDYAPLQSLGQVPPEADVIVVLPGFPPTRAAAEAWNLVPARLRIVVVVDGPPPSSTVIADLNTLRGLERVIARMNEPSRSGFERLQRPMSFLREYD